MKFLIDFKADALDADISAYLQQHGCTVLKEWDNFDKIFLVEAAAMPPESAITDRVKEENHLSISPLEVINLNPHYGTHNDPAHPDIVVQVNDTKDWWKNYSYIQPEFNNPTMTIKRLGHNINVYIMDSGIEASHPEFANANIVNLYSVTPGSFADNKGHGTAIASLIAGATCGITDATLKIVKIFDPNHATTEHEFLDAIDAIINDHVDNTYSVLNASWAIPKNEWVEHKLRILEDEGVFIITASGNDGSSIEDVTPAGMIDAVTVGAYNQQLQPCNFSNYTGGSIVSVTGGSVNHGELDGWAPGEQVWAAGLNGTYGYVAGTSFAAAISSAVLASNLTWWAEDNGQRVLGFEDEKISAAVENSANWIFKRPDLLDLSIDPKYQNSFNRIATLSDRNHMSALNAPDELETYFRIGEPSQNIRILQPLLTKSIEWIVPLPVNFTLLRDGRIYGAPDISQGPGENELYKTYTVVFTRTLVTDVSETVTVKMHILPANLEPSSLPSDDPLSILLTGYGLCTGLSTFCSYTGEQNYCSDQCAFGCCNQGPGKAFYACACQ